MTTAALSDVIQRGETLLVTLSDEQYSQKIPAAYDASIGGHYRHCLDHFKAFFDGLETGTMDYDARARDPRLENDRALALTLTQTLSAQAASLPASAFDRSIQVRCQTSYTDVGEAVANSTVAREAMFCVSHAVHHHALIGMMCSLLHVPLPPDFGVAPSTKKHREIARAA